MFIHAVPDNRGKKENFFCSLVEFKRINEISCNKTILSFGFIPTTGVPYLKAACNCGDPEAILAKEQCSQEKRQEAQNHE